MNATLRNAACLGCLLVFTASVAAEDFVGKTARLKENDISESSGLAVSHREENHWWTHNDSGGEAKLFAFHGSGKSTGECRLKNVDAKDWEDMASFVDDGQPRLIVADCGDNLATRTSISLYIFDEPNPDKSKSIKRFQELQVTFSDGARNCEAIAVDPRRRKIILIEKSTLPLCGIYCLDLPHADLQRPKLDVIAQRTGTLMIPMVTAMDLDPNSGDVWVINYFQGFRFRRRSTEQSFVSQMKTLPAPIKLPKWKQIEAIAVGRQSDVWVTSEGEPAPFGRLKVDD